MSSATVMWSGTKNLHLSSIGRYLSPSKRSITTGILFGYLVRISAASFERPAEKQKLFENYKIFYFCKCWNATIASKTECAIDLFDKKEKRLNETTKIHYRKEKKLLKCVHKREAQTAEGDAYTAGSGCHIQQTESAPPHSLICLSIPGITL